MLNYGVLVKTQYDIPGKTKGCAMLHISQISDEKIEDLSKVFKVGQEIKNARVVKLNRDTGKVNLSTRGQGKRMAPLETLHGGDEDEGRGDSHPEVTSPLGR